MLLQPSAVFKALHRWRAILIFLHWADAPARNLCAKLRKRQLPHYVPGLFCVAMNNRAAARPRPSSECSRRAFIRSTALAGIGALAIPAAAAVPSRDAQWQIGCYTRPFDQHDYRTALDGIAEAGFAGKSEAVWYIDGVHLTGYVPDIRPVVAGAWAAHEAGFGPGFIGKSHRP